MLYYTPGDAIVTKDEFFEKISTGQVTEFIENIRLRKPGVKSITFSNGTLTPGNITPFQPIGIGKPLTIMIRQIYTGKYPQSFFGSRKDMLATSAVKSITSFEEKPKALNYLMEKVSTNNVIEHPPAATSGTQFVFYSPALVDISLTLDLSVVFDNFPQPIFTQVGNALQTAA
ncbi:MAG: hypothetical protein WCB46_04065, partial [Methanoregula sp.]